MKIGLLLLALAVIKCPRYVASADIFDDQPKILVKDGNLVFESADSRNISIRLKGKSHFLINNIKVFDNLNPLDKMPGEGTVSEFSNELQKLQAQLTNLKSTVKGRYGILKRLEQLESGVSVNSSDSRGSRSRSRLLNRKLSVLEMKVANITDRLMQDHCKSYPCQNGGTCFNMFETFRCECTDSWEGPTCTLDFDECAKFEGTELGCQNGATCMNVPGSYECQCKDQWKGLHCTSQKMDCLSVSGIEVCGHGTCVQAKNKLGYDCICEQGWRRSNETQACINDVDECKEMRPHCSDDPKVMCINTPGSFVCGPCPSGYVGNGFTCDDIDECQINNGGCSVLPKVECINMRGSSRCGNCPPGYAGDGKTCVPNALRPNFACADSSICNEHAQCFEYSNLPPACQCRPGYTGNGFGENGCIYVEVDACSALKCLNGGTCINNGTSLFCECPTGVSGILCQLTSDPCASNPCFNRGNCTDARTRSGYKCTCIKGFTGENCENQISGCGVREAESGTIRYPENSLEPYAHNSRCAWRITTNNTKVLNVTFTKFNVEDGLNCKYDWLQIHDGPSSSSHMIGRFCGDRLPKNGTIISTHNEMFLWFISDNNTAGDGFELMWETIDPICGGELNVTTHGSIASPGSPGNYPPNRDCEWFIAAPPGKRIQFLFHTLMIEAHKTCAYDYVEVHTGLGTFNPSLGKYCNTTNPPPLTTPSHTATVHFHSDEDSSDKGFQIVFAVIDGVPGCGGTFTAARGEIASPMDSATGRYKNNMNCDYVLQMPYGTRVRIKFSTFALEKTLDCRLDRIEIFEGSTYNEQQLVGRYCGSDMPPRITSQSNILTVRFVSDVSASYEGFIFQYQLICGGVFAYDQGIISSPNYPNLYEGERACEYYIEAPLGQSIVFNVLDMDIERDVTCDFDYLEIFDSLAPDAASSLGKFCGQTKPPAFVSSFNHLRVRFLSDAKDSGRGFQANYSFIDAGCGGILSNASAVITPPGDTDADGTYKPHANCRWLVYAPVGHVIQMTFLNFDLDQEKGCKHDFVTIFNNGSGKGEAIGPFCGKKAPKIVTTPDNIATVLFHSGSNTTHEGFTITLDFIDATKLCGGHFYSSQGILKSPGSPNYLNNKICEWIITAPERQQIELVFEYFELEGEAFNECRSDMLQIRNGDDSSAPLIGTFCWDKVPLPIRSFGNQLYLKFVSDHSMNAKGFKVKWDATIIGCGGRLTGIKGSISSPNYPEPYAHNAQCEWQISVNEGYTIEIIFTDLDLEVAADCKSNYLEIFDGDNAGSKSIVVCSAGHQPNDIVTSGNHALLRMVSDVSQAGRGFFLQYSINCNRTISATSGVIESPNFPNKYINNFNCAWTIVVPKGNRIYYQFSHLEMEIYDLECKHDFVEVSETGSTQKQRYCHVATKTSLKNEIIVVFHTDSTYLSTGFRMEWYTEGCGGKLTHPNGTLTSPHFRQENENELVCIWEIDVQYGNRIEITIIDIGVEKSLNCVNGHVAYAYDRNFNDTIAKFCSDMDKNQVTTSRGHQLFVKFESKEFLRGRGLIISYKSVESDCGGSFFGSQGVISSEGYPSKNYQNNKTCEWYLKTYESHTIVLKLFDFILEASVNCTKDFVEIFDPVLEKQLWKGCGSQFPNKSTIQSERNEMLVRLVTDSEINSKGFEAQYTTSCGSRIVTSSSGMVNYQRDKDDNCLWTIISQDPSKKIVLTFTHVRVFHDGLCSVTINIFEGFSDTGPLKASFCGVKTPPAIHSYGNALTVKLNSAGMSHVSEFEFYYSVLDTDCGGSYSKTMEGEFASPRFPDSTPLNTRCIWTISAASGNEMSLTFNSFDIASSPNCNDNYLEVRRNNQNGDLIGVFCGNKLPTNIESGSFWIKYQTDGYSTSAGFLAAFKYNQHSDLMGSSGIIESPRFDKFSSKVEQQTYRITVKQGSVIFLEFPVFYVQESCGLSDDCANFMEVFNGYDSTAPKFEYENSARRALPMLSDGNIVFIKLTSRYMLEANVKIEWKEGFQETIDNNCRDKVILLQNDTEIVNITSTGYPNGYDSGLNCSWTIMSGNPNFHPVVMIRDVDLEDIEGCIGDYLKISADREDGSWKELAKLCNFDIRERQAFDGTPNLLLEFQSDYGVNGTGFDVFVFLECGGKLTQSEGIIEYTIPSTHRTRIVYECQWNITVRRGRTIQFEFIEMNIAKITDACSSYVTLRNGIDGMSPFLGEGQYCGSVLPQLPPTSSNRAFVKFKADYQLKDAFRLRYRETQHDCGGKIRLTHQNRSTTFSSPNYPNIPHPATECTWTIIAPIGERIRVDFIEKFDLNDDEGCSKEYVEIRDGSTIAAPWIGTFCAQKPPTQRSKSNVMMIKFFTDLVEPKTGFKVNISIDICGGSIISNAGFLSSTNYPATGAYPNKAQCDYRITANELYTFRLTLVDLDLPPPVNRTHCDLSKDHLVLYSVDPEMDTGFEGNLIEIATLCGNTTLNTTYASDTNEVLVRLNSFAKTKHLYRGFRISYNSAKKQCGGDISGESGVLTSPGYPSKTLKRIHCFWKITVPKGRRVKLEFLDVDLSADINSFFQRIGIFNEFTYENRLTWLTGKSELNPVYSSDNKMLISFLVLQASNNRGIKMQFSSDAPTICQGSLNGNEGVIYPPADQNITSFICEYIREDKPIIPGQAKGGTIALHFSNLALGNVSSVCLRSTTGITVERLSGGNPAERVLAKICSDMRINETIVASPFPGIMLEFYHNKAYGSLSFTMNYKAHACGGHRSNPGNIIVSNLETSSSTDVDCAWLLEYEEDSSVFINITKLQLKGECLTEYIVIYDGPTAASPVLSILCDSLFPRNGLVSQKSTIFIHYHTNDYVGGSKNSVFELKVSSASDRCGGILSRGNTGFKTPLYGKPYPHNTECIWEIRSEPGTHIGLTFVDRFFIEDSENCTKDYVEVFEFYDSEWRSLGKRCGRNVPQPFNSTTERMKVMFRSDASGSGDGFSAVWNQNCGGVFEATSTLAAIFSPGFPNNYLPNLFCNYTIIAPPKSYLELNFPEFSLETTAFKCSEDNVTVFKSPDYLYDPSQWSPLEKLGVFCGKNGPPPQRIRTIASVIFQTDPWVQKQGFTFTYKLEACGGSVTAAEMITTPEIDVSLGVYRGPMDCQWNITAPLGKKIVIKFEKFSMGQSTECYSDFIELFNGTKVDSSQRLAKMCGNLTNIIKPIVTESSEAVLLWRTEQNTANIGFSAAIYFRPMCDKKIEITSDHSFLLDMSNSNFSESMECIYKIVGEPLSSIKMTFTSINLSICDPDIKSARCDCDYVEVHDGNGPFSRPIGEKYCGYDLPRIPDIISTGSALYVRFVTDSIRPSTGFAATFTVVPSPCSSQPYLKLTGNESDPHSFTSPLKPGTNYYPPNIHCTWIVEASEGMIFDIHFDKFELEDSLNCENDSLTIEDGDINEYVTEGLGEETIYSGRQAYEPSFYSGISGPTEPHVYCGSKLPHDYISGSRKIRIHFRTNSENEFSGINFTIRTLRACARNFTALTGRLLTTTDLNDCNTTITVPENHTISLFFHRFWIYEQDSTKAFLKVYDGAFDSGTLLKTVTGYTSPDPIFSTRNQLSLFFHFSEDTAEGMKGFHDILYVATDKGRGCGGTIYNYGGIFSSPMYPNANRSIYDCTWVVTVPQNLKVALRFSFFDMGSKILCSSDYVEFLEKDLKGVVVPIKRYCGDDDPAVYVSTRSTMKIHYKQSINFAGTGWMLNFMGVQEGAKPQNW